MLTPTDQLLSKSSGISQSSTTSKKARYARLITTASDREEAYAKLHWPQRPERDQPSWCNTHYGPPSQPREKPALSNLWGFMLLTPVLVIFNVLSRSYVIYDVVTDLLVTYDLIEAQEPLWTVVVSASLMLLPGLLKVLIFRSLSLKLLTGDEDRGCWGFSPCVAHSLYLFLAFPFFLLIDFYFLIFFPWAKPSTMVLGPLERISPVIETLFESTGQTIFQLWIYWSLHSRTGHNGIHRTHVGLGKRLIMSFVPNLFAVAYRLYEQNKKAVAIGMPLCEYLPLLVKAPLGISAPFLEIMGDKTTECIDYTGLGPLNDQQQEQIFSALGNEDAILPKIIFDDSNILHLEQHAKFMEGNRSLKEAWFGTRHSLEDAHAVLHALDCSNNVNSRCVVEIGLIELQGEDTRKWLKRVSPCIESAREILEAGSVAGRVQEGRHAVQELEMEVEGSGLLGGCALARQVGELLQPFEELAESLKAASDDVLRKNMSGLIWSELKFAVESVETPFREALNQAKRAGLDDSIIRSCLARDADFKLTKFRKQLDAIDEVRQAASHINLAAKFAQEPGSTSSYGDARPSQRDVAQPQTLGDLKDALNRAMKLGVQDSVLTELPEMKEAQEIIRQKQEIMEQVWGAVAKIETLDELESPVAKAQIVDQSGIQLNQGLSRAKEHGIDPCEGKASAVKRLEKAQDKLDDYTKSVKMFEALAPKVLGMF